MRRITLRTGLALALLAVLGIVSASLAVSPAAARTTRIPFDNYNILCTVKDPGTEWVAGQTYHYRGMVLEGVEISVGAEEYFGPGETVANGNVHLVTGHEIHWGTNTNYPEAYPDGYWFGHWTMQITRGRQAGIAQVQGYGELEGLMVKSEMTPLTEEELEDYTDLCDGEMPISGVRAVGFIMHPGGE